MSSPTPNPSQSAGEQLRLSLGLGPGPAIEPERVAELARLGAEFIASVDRSVGAAWKGIAGGSRMRHATGAKAVMARYASGDPETNQARLKQELDRLRTMTGGLVSAVERAGDQFAQRHLERFSPDGIEAAAKLVPGTFMALEAKCWKKYRELSEHHDKSAIEQEIRDAIADYTERLLEGLGR